MSTSLIPYYAILKIDVVQTYDKDKATQYFEALNQGGQVNDPLQASFFSPAYGNVTDKFGIMFRILTKCR